MYSIGVAAALLGVCIKILRRWDKSKKIKCVQTLGGHGRFPIQEIQNILKGKRDSGTNVTRITIPNNKCAIYGRVSSHKQKKRDDLSRQIEVMKDFAQEKKQKIYKEYKDIGSGLNTRRKGLWRLIRDARTITFL